MKEKKVRDLINPVTNKPYGVYNRYDEYLNLLYNAVKIVDKETQEEIDFITERQIKEKLFVNGSVGYDKSLNRWFNVYGQGINQYGNPTRLILITDNGKTITKNACYDDRPNGTYKILALPDEMSMAMLIKEATNFMTNCEVAMRQNLEACKTPYIVVCKNKELELSFKQAIKQKQDGQAVVVVSEELGDGLKSIDIGVEYLVDKFAEIRDLERNTLLNKLGIMTANVGKRERVQGAEVNATIGQATDYIYLLIDTFNKQCNSYGINLEMQLNGSLEEIYLDGEDEDEINEVDVNDVEGKDNIND